ncbi:Rho-related GTP-binding protein RhoB [Cucumispora dikerogammari]|nr:Rho-related GTP-binding protein RhoB [Cucumispora dikerogammari]
MATHNIQGKIVVVGDGACGKTCLLEVFRRDKFPEEYIPTVVDNFSKNINVDGQSVALTLWDTAGQEDFDSVRPLSYKDTSVIILCYSIENSEMLINIKEKWIFEIKNYCPDAPFYLVALKSDIREMSTSKIDQSSLITMTQGEELAEEIGAEGFFECSALKGHNINNIFESAARLIIKKNSGSSGPSGGFNCCGLC